MNIPLSNRIVLAIVITFIVSSECFPSRTKSAGHRRHRHALRSHHKGRGKIPSTKKDSVNQQAMAAVMHPGKLDMSDERDLDQLQDFNKAFINNEMAAETSLLANQGIDDDSALRISNMAALPNGVSRTSSKKGMDNNIKGDTVAIRKPSVAGYSPDEYLLDANSWPEYRIKDSDYSSRNYRVFPQAGQQQGGNYQSGFLGGGMPYGQRVADGMEGPYGDGNYGFSPSPPQMVSDEPDAPNNPQDDGSQITMSPMNDRIQKLVMKHRSRLNDAAKQNFGDEATFMSPNAHRDASGSGADQSGSGAVSNIANAVPLIPQSQLVSSVKTTEEASGQVTVDTKPEDATIPSQGKISGDPSSTTILPGKSDQQTSKQTPDQQAQTNQKSSNSASDKDNNTESKQDRNRDSKPQDSKPQDSKPQDSKPQDSKPQDSKPQDSKPQDSKPQDSKPQDSKPQDSKPQDIKPQDSKPQDSKPTAGQTNKARPSSGSSDATTESHSQTNSPLGEFAKFLKAKGITLTINKGKASVKEQQAEGQGNAKGSFAPPANMQPTPEVRPSADESSMAGGRSPSNAESPSVSNAVSQDASLTNAVMHWQNAAPQSNQMGELFLRHDTKQPHH